MHGFCTVFARFQNVQRVQIVAKSDKGCRNSKLKTCDVSQRNDDKTQLPKIEGIARRALRISRPGVRVPSIAPNNENPNFFPIGEGFGFFVFFGNENAAVAQQ